jgi:hypothetical protein
VFDGEHVDVSPRLRRRLDELPSRFAVDGLQVYEAVHVLVALEALVTEPRIPGRQALIEITARQALEAGCTPEDIAVALGRDVIE